MFQGGELDGEVAEGGAFGFGAFDLQAGGLLGEAVEKGVLAAAADDVEMGEVATAEALDEGEDFGVTGGEAVEDERGHGRGIGGGGVEFGEVTATELRVDAGGHVALQKKVGVVDVDEVAGCGDVFGGGDDFRDSEG